MPGSWGTCPGPRVQDSCLRVRRTGCQGLRVGERWPGFQALRTGRKRALSEHLLCAHNFLLPVPATPRPWRFPVPSLQRRSGCLIGTRLFQVSRLSPQRQKVRLARRPGSAASALPARDCQAVPGRGACGSHHVQNSCVLKHLPSSRLTTPPITSAANTVNVKPRACKTGLRQSQGRW